MKDIIGKPIFFEKNRVGRVYRGGKLFSTFFDDNSEDGHMPEEWIASTVKSEKGCAPGEIQGLSVVAGEGIPFDALISGYKEEMLGGRESFDVLTKVLDSAVRLPVQAHPDKAFAKKHFGKDYGKTEMWLVLDTRENARVYFGFKEGVTRESFEAAIEKSETDPNAMPSLLNEIPVKAGDVFLIPARVIHAIGAGCLVLEAQEPTDFTIEPEHWCDDYHLSETEMYMGLDKETALQCFDFCISNEEVKRVSRPGTTVLRNTESVFSETLVTYEHTTCFAMNRHTVKPYRNIDERLYLVNAPAVFLVIEGEGELLGASYRKIIKKGDYFFLPHITSEKFWVNTNSRIQLSEVLPSKECAL